MSSGNSARAGPLAWHRGLAGLQAGTVGVFVLLGYLKTWLRLQPEVGAALLSGSGSTVFAVLRDGSDHNSLAERIRSDVDPNMWTFACQTL